MKAISNLRIRTIQIVILIVAFVGISNISAARNLKGDSLKYSGVIRVPEENFKFGEMFVQYTLDDGFSRPGIGKQFFLYPRILNGGKFGFKLPNLNKPYKINIVIKSETKRTIFWEMYYVEGNDDVKMEIVIKDLSSTVFSGKGAEKFVVAQALVRQYSEFNAALRLIDITSSTSAIKSSTELDSKLFKLVDLIRKYKIKKRKTIKSSELSPKMKTILSYEFAKYNNIWRFTAESLLKKYPCYSDSIYANYFKYNQEFTDYPNDLSLLCPSYIYNLSLQVAFELSKENGAKAHILRVYNTIKNKYYQDLKDRLIGDILLQKNILNHIAPFDNRMRDSLYNDASKTVKNPAVKNAILNKISELGRIAGKQKVINSEFTTIDNKKIELESLKGKVILIDTWFPGCYGCILFHEKFGQEIYPLFKNNKKFVVLSINISKKKEDWKKGIATGKYTSEAYINVNTGEGIGINHSFMKYYGVKGAPYLMLIDANGDVVYVPEIFDAKKMIKWINNSLISADQTENESSRNVIQ